MKKLLSLILASVGLRWAYAQDLISCPDGTMADPSVGCVAPPPSIANPEAGLSDLFLKIASIVSWAVLAAATVSLVWGGVLYATAMGQEDKLQKAKRLIFWAVIGLGVGLLAKVLISGIGTLLS